MVYGRFNKYSTMGGQIETKSDGGGYGNTVSKTMKYKCRHFAGTCFDCPFPDCMDNDTKPGQRGKGKRIKVGD